VCDLDGGGFVLWTAGQRKDPTNVDSKFVWKEKHDENRRDIPRNLPFFLDKRRRRRRRSASSSQIIGTIGRDYLMYDMHYENWIEGHPREQEGNACVGMSAERQDKYGWLAMSCEEELCFVCENPNVILGKKSRVSPGGMRR